MRPEIKQILTYLGLSTDQVSAYLACLKLGSGTASQIAKAAKQTRTGVYAHLEELESRGMVHAAIERGVKTYQASNPSVITAIASRQKDEIDAVMPFLLTQFAETKSGKPQFRFYRDADGARLVLEEVLANPTKFYRIFGSIYEKEFTTLIGEKFWLGWSKRRIAAKVNHQSLRPQASKKLVGKVDPIFTDSGPHVFREIRFAPDSVRLPILIYLFDNKVAFVNARPEHSYAAVLESKDVFDSLGTIFETIWAISEPAKKK